MFRVILERSEESRFLPSLSPVRERMKVRVRVQRAISRAIQDSASVFFSSPLLNFVSF